MTFDDAYKLFLAYARADRQYAKESLIKLEDCFRNWIAPFLSGKSLEDLTLLQLTTLRSAMISKNLSTSRQYAVLMWLKIFLGFCRSYLKLPVLPASDIKLPSRPAPVVSFLTNDEVRQVVAAIPMNTLSGKRLRALTELLLGTGLRISEALSLERAPFDGAQPVIWVRGKGGIRRKVFITERALKWVTTYLRSRFDHFTGLFATSGDPPRRLARADISRFFVRLRKQAGLAKRLTPHILRHTYCTNLLNNGVDIRFIRDLAGHRDIATTARYYLGVDDEKLRELVATRLDYNQVPVGAI